MATIAWMNSSSTVRRVLRYQQTVKLIDILANIDLPCHANTSSGNMIKKFSNKATKNATRIAKVTFEHEHVEDYYEKKKDKKRHHKVNRSKFTERIPITLPDLGDEVRGKITKWYHEEGDVIQQGHTLCDIKTNKMFTFGLDMDDTCLGILEKRLEPEGGKFCDPGTKLCIMLYQPEE